MNKLILAFIFSLFLFQGHAQGYEKVMQTINKANINEDVSEQLKNYTLEGKKFGYVRDSIDHTQKSIIDFKQDHLIALTEVIMDKSENHEYTNQFTGDVIKRGNRISVRADRLDGKRIGMPLSYNFLLTYKDGYYFLVDINTREKWIETKYLDRK